MPEIDIPPAPPALTPEDRALWLGLQLDNARLQHEVERLQDELAALRLAHPLAEVRIKEIPMPDDTPAPPDLAALLERIAALERALEHATLVIENYEMDIRNSAWTGVNLAAVGFCQGVIYRRALRTIQQLARATPPAATGA